MGEITTGALTGNRTIVLSSRISTAGSLFLTLGHELMHAYTMAWHGDLIDQITDQYGEYANEVFNEYIAYQWEAGMGNQILSNPDTWAGYFSAQYIGEILIYEKHYRGGWRRIELGFT